MADWSVNRIIEITIEITIEIIIDNPVNTFNSIFIKAFIIQSTFSSHNHFLGVDFSHICTGNYISRPFFWIIYNLLSSKAFKDLDLIRMEVFIATVRNEMGDIMGDMFKTSCSRVTRCNFNVPMVGCPQ